MKSTRFGLYGLLTILMGFAAACGSDGGGGGSDTPANNYPGGGFEGIETPAQNPSYLGGGSTTPNTNGPAQVTILLTDAPNPTIESAEVTISEVTLHQTGGGWVSVLSEEITLDLLDLQGGITEMLGQVEMEDGKVTQIRLVVTDASVVADGQTYTVDIPSGEIKLNTPFDVCGGGAIELTLDFDAEASLRYNPGHDSYRLQPVIKIESVVQDCPAEDGDDDDDEFDGPTGWLSIVVPPVTVEDFQSANATVDDVQIHDQGIGQVTTFTETYSADLLEEERQISEETTDPVTGETTVTPLYTVLIPPIEVPAGDLDQVRLFLQSLDLVAADGRPVSIQLPSGNEESDGLKFFGTVTVCEDALTILQWDLVLDADSVDWSDPDGVIVLHPVIQNPNVLVTCEPVEDTGDDDDANVEEGEDDDEGDDDDETDDDDDDEGDEDDEGEDDESNPS